ncbi:hypothetical protein BpHYR1_042891 [Brachionus plicatilis]|uniref:Uncharacterized protein n=1 Tax=Brachionus plicatilis TaxID=10195 RepID=A0A3M7RKE2_BRAPC|nr:hypothetical protein BpHYR1_042891 [Brachionus plicatilis]
MFISASRSIYLLRYLNYLDSLFYFATPKINLQCCTLNRRSVKHNQNAYSQKIILKNFSQLEILNFFTSYYIILQALAAVD